MVVIVRYGEIGLKGQNRPYFENKLAHNIRDCLNKNNIGFDLVLRKTGRIFIQTEDECTQLKNVFGISSFSKAIECKPDLEEIKAAALGLYKQGTFRVSANTLAKYKLNSLELNQEIGAYIVEKTKAKVSLKNPDTNIGIEIISTKAYLFTEKHRGPGGLPIGTQGLVAVLLEDEKSINAAILMIKRGCTVTFVSTGINLNLEKFKEYAYGQNVKVVNEIPAHAEAIVVSDTIRNLRQRNFKIPVLRPLIGEYGEDKDN